MSIFDNIRTIGDSLTSIVVATCGISQSVENLVDSTNCITSACKAHATELELDAVFECEKNSLTREQRIAEHKAKLAELAK